jgi:translation elongation factor EF-1alpha
VINYELFSEFGNYLSFIYNLRDLKATLSFSFFCGCNLVRRNATMEWYNSGFLKRLPNTNKRSHPANKPAMLTAQWRELPQQRGET